MKVTEIIVSAGRTFNNPYESYANFKPQVTMKVLLSPEDDPATATKALQAQAEQLVEDHKNHLLESLRKLEQMKEAARQVAQLSEMIEQSQRKVAALREQHPQLPCFDAKPDPLEDDEEDKDEYEHAKR